VTLLGQPGVAEATASNFSLAVPGLVAGFGKTLTLETVARSSRGFLGREVIEFLTDLRFSGEAIIVVQASVSSLNTNRAAIEAVGGVFQESIENTTRQIAKGNRLSKFKFRTDLFKFEVALEEIDALVDRVNSAGRLVQKGGHRAITSIFSLGLESISRPSSKRIPRFPGLSRLRAGFATDAFLGGVFQYIEDTQNPYFTPTQRGGRVLIASFGSGVAGIAGSYIGGALACGPYAPFCIAGASFLTAGAWTFVGQPIVFDLFPALQPPLRNLQPLQPPN
jgi:hypothetical protein